MNIGIKKIIKMVGMASIGLLLIISFFSSFYTVDEGHVGIVKRFGKAITQVDPGFHLKIPFADVIRPIEVRTRKSVETMNAATFEQMKMTAVTSVNWTVNKSAALQLYSQYGGLDQFEERILDPRLRSASKAGLAMFKAEELIRNRNAAINKIEELFKIECDSLPINIGDIQLENYTLPESYTRSIETKQTELNLSVAEKHKLVKDSLVRQRSVNKANADRKILMAIADGIAYKTKTEAEATAYAIRLKGKAEAEAIKAKARALASNKTLVEYTRAQNWNGQLPTTMMGSGTNVLWKIQ